MELTMIIASVALFIVAIVIGFIAGGIFFKIKQDYDEINQEIDRIGTIVNMLKTEAIVRTMNNNRSAKKDDENKKDM